MSRSDILGNDGLYCCDMLDCIGEHWKLDVKLDFFLRVWCAM